jgi:hypothetical protein
LLIGGVYRELEKWDRIIVPKATECVGAAKLVPPVSCAMGESLSFILAEIDGNVVEALLSFRVSRSCRRVRDGTSLATSSGSMPHPNSSHVSSTLNVLTVWRNDLAPKTVTDHDIRWHSLSLTSCCDFCPISKMW